MSQENLNNTKEVLFSRIKKSLAAAVILFSLVAAGSVVYSESGEDPVNVQSVGNNEELINPIEPIALDELREAGEMVANSSNNPEGSMTMSEMQALIKQLENQLELLEE